MATTANKKLKKLQAQLKDVEKGIAATDRALEQHNKKGLVIQKRKENQAAKKTELESKIAELEAAAPEGEV